MGGRRGREGWGGRGGAGAARAASQPYEQQSSEGGGVGHALVGRAEGAGKSGKGRGS